MNLFKSLLILMIFLIASCKKQVPPLTQVYDFGEVEALRGKVKQIIMGADTPHTNFFYRADFNREGYLTYIRSTRPDTRTVRRKTSNLINTRETGYKYEFDKNGNKTAVIASTHADSSFISKYEFDKNGLLIKYINNTQDSLSYIGSYNYDIDGNILGSKIVLNNNTDTAVTKNRFDSHGNMVAFEYFRNRTLIFAIDFKILLFDSHKNWTKCIMVTKPGLSTSLKAYQDTINRKITYY
ncbi:hypothetical protein [Mucilaginibacter sp.]|uniref:hypothetical protein n=1 Tax=Mucilaginibacter sp. TaxID=1882438 RepID=UPI0025DC208D|nr:hypothetical protein [Mucilaginibacter sp.]